MDKFDTDAFHKYLRSSVVGRKFVYMDITGSTMDDARKLAHDVKEYPHGTVVMSERQTKARGAKDHTWDATNTGNIYASVVLHRPPFCKTFEGSFDLEVAACLAVLQVVKEFGIPRVKPKWPNDLWVSGHKLAGFLLEDGRLDIPGSTDCLFILGIGINVNADVRGSKELQSIATSMVCERGGQFVDREKFLAEVCASLERMLASRKEELLTAFVRENLFQENCELSISDLASGKILDGKFMAICKNWEVKFLDLQTDQVLKGTSEVYSIRPKVTRKVMIVFSSLSNSSLVSCLSKWLTAVIDTSKYVVCLIPEDTITASDEWMKSCSLLVLVDGVSDPDLLTSKLDHFLKSGGKVMASGERAVFVANLLDIHVEQVMLDETTDREVVPVSLQVKTTDSQKLTASEENVFKTASTALSVGDNMCSVVQSDSSMYIHGTVVFPAHPKCFHFLESFDCQPRDSMNELGPAVSGTVISDKLDSRGGQVRVYIHTDDSQHDLLIAFTEGVKTGGHVALWGLDILRDVRGLSAHDMSQLDMDRFHRDGLLQTVLQALLPS